MKPFKTPPAPFPIAPIHAAHAIQLELYTDTRNVIQIWLPEHYGQEPRRCMILNSTEDRRFRMEGERLITTYHKPESFILCGEIWPIEDGVGMSLAITNISDTILPASMASVCIQFATAPSFSDTKLERYFYVSGGELIFFKPPYDNCDNDGAWLFTTSDHQVSPSHLPQNPPPDFPFIGLQSADGKWVVGHSWQKSLHIWGNCHPSMSCLHADPYFDELAPGATEQLSGVLYIMEGTPETSLARFQQEFQCPSNRKYLDIQSTSTGCLINQEG